MLRVIGFSARRMQRLGFLKHLIATASPQRPTTTVSMGKSLLRVASRKYPTVVLPEKAEYCDRVFTEQHYAALRAQVKAAAELQPVGKVDLELQDIYLSQDILPSKRGRILAERDKDLYVFPALAVSLGLLTPETLVLTARGRLLASVLSTPEVDAFNQPSGVNPLAIRPGQAVALLYCFLEEDGDLLSALWPAVARIQGDFTDYEVGDLIGELLEALILRSAKKSPSMDDRVQIAKLNKAVTMIKKWKNKPYGGKGTRDEWATLRLEPFVDLGLLQKADKFAYRYALTDAGRRFSEVLEKSGDLSSLLSNGYVNAVAQLLNLDASPVADSGEALEALKESNRLLANNIGYSGLAETSLLAAINLLQTRNRVLEIGDSIRIMKEAQRQTPHEIHFNIDRWGNVKFVSFRRL